jgi:hypothetical protein
MVAGSQLTNFAGKLLLAFASTLILGSYPDGTHDLILLSDGSGSFHSP